MIDEQKRSERERPAAADLILKTFPACKKPDSLRENAEHCRGWQTGTCSEKLEDAVHQAWTMGPLQGVHVRRCLVPEIMQLANLAACTG